MNSYIVFFPNATEQSAAVFKAAGLDDVAANAKWFDWPNTPTNQPGKFAVWGDPTRASTVPMHYEPEAQHWADMGKYWLGWWHDRVPDPESLKRPEMIDGRWAVLGDGNAWLLPCITGLPVSFRLDADGKEGPHVKPRWQNIEARMLWAFEHLSDNWLREQPFDEPACRMYVAEMLAVNYRLTPPMAYELGLIDSETWMAAFGATLDHKRLMELRETILRRGE